MDRTKDITFKLKAFDTEIECNLIPLKQKDAGRVFHTCVAQLVTAIAGAVDGNEGFSKEKLIAGAAKDFAKIDYDLVWNTAQTLCKDALINNKEVSDLGEVEEIADAPWLLYLIIYHGIKGNWPRVFSSLGTKFADFGSQLRNHLQIVTED